VKFRTEKIKFKKYIKLILDTGFNENGANSLLDTALDWFSARYRIGMVMLDTVIGLGHF
jgi:hypothetical protein